MSGRAAAAGLVPVAVGGSPVARPPRGMSPAGVPRLTGLSLASPASASSLIAAAAAGNSTLFAPARSTSPLVPPAAQQQPTTAAPSATPTTTTITSQVVPSSVLRRSATVDSGLLTRSAHVRPQSASALSSGSAARTAPPPQQQQQLAGSTSWTAPSSASTSALASSRSSTAQQRASGDGTLLLPRLELSQYISVLKADLLQLAVMLDGGVGGAGSSAQSLLAPDLQAVSVADGDRARAQLLEAFVCAVHRAVARTLATVRDDAGADTAAARRSTTGTSLAGLASTASPLMCIVAIVDRVRELHARAAQQPQQQSAFAVSGSRDAEPARSSVGAQATELQGRPAADARLQQLQQEREHELQEQVRRLTREVSDVRAQLAAAADSARGADVLATERANALRRELDEHGARLVALQDRNAAQQREADATHARLRAAEAELREVQARAADLRARLAASDARVIELTRALGEQQANAEHQRATAVSGATSPLAAQLREARADIERAQGELALMRRDSAAERARLADETAELRSQLAASHAAFAAERERVEQRAQTSAAASEHMAAENAALASQLRTLHAERQAVRDANGSPSQLASSLATLRAQLRDAQSEAIDAEQRTRSAQADAASWRERAERADAAERDSRLRAERAEEQLREARASADEVRMLEAMVAMLRARLSQSGAHVAEPASRAAGLSDELDRMRVLQGELEQRVADQQRELVQRAQHVRSLQADLAAARAGPPRSLPLASAPAPGGPDMSTELQRLRFSHLEQVKQLNDTFTQERRAMESRMRVLAKKCELLEDRLAELET